MLFRTNETKSTDTVFPYPVVLRLSAAPRLRFAFIVKEPTADGRPAGYALRGRSYYVHVYSPLPDLGSRSSRNILRARCLQFREATA